MDGHETFQHAVTRLTEVTIGAVARGRPRRSRTSTSSSSTRPTARIIRAVGQRLGLEPAHRVVDCIARAWQHVGRHDPARAVACCARTAACARARQVLLAAFGAGFTWGAGVVEWGIA